MHFMHYCACERAASSRARINMPLYCSETGEKLKHTLRINDFAHCTRVPFWMSGIFSPSITARRRQNLRGPSIRIWSYYWRPTSATCKQCWLTYVSASLILHRLLLITHFFFRKADHSTSNRDIHFSSDWTTCAYNTILTRYAQSVTLCLYNNLTRASVRSVMQFRMRNI